MKQQRQRRKTLWGIGLAIVVVGLVLWMVPSRAVAIAPGVTGNLAQMVRVKGAPVKGKGRMMMVAVQIMPLNALQYLIEHVDPNVKIISDRTAMGGMDFSQYEKINQMMMEQSQMAAEIAGERLAGLPAQLKKYPGALVVSVIKNSPAQHHLQAGDIITRIGTKPVSSPQSIPLLLRPYAYGQRIALTVKKRKGGQPHTVWITLSPSKKKKLGIVAAAVEQAQIPRPVTIHSQGIGGPSAGLMFSLEIYRQISGKNLARGRTIAGTGAITPSGQVQPIGGVQQKVITVHRSGASIFLVPAANYAAAESMARRKGYTHFTVYPVHTLQQACEILEKH
ncbi:MAG: PDZ domain-containing protein [Firmicutes bacterium]|nr:PDZ domain-containing protein [Bacillota bacterium]